MTHSTRLLQLRVLELAVPAPGLSSSCRFFAILLRAVPRTAPPVAAFFSPRLQVTARGAGGLKLGTPARGQGASRCALAYGARGNHAGTRPAECFMAAGDDRNRARTIPAHDAGRLDLLELFFTLLEASESLDVDLTPGAHLCQRVDAEQLLPLAAKEGDLVLL